MTSFKPSETFAAAANDEFERHRGKIAAAVPDAEIHHVGGTSVPGALTKGDLDVQVRVTPERFADAASRLAELYAKSKMYVWDDGFAAFEAPADGLAGPTAISVVAIGSAYDWCGAALWGSSASYWPTTVRVRPTELAADYEALRRRIWV